MSDLHHTLLTETEIDVIIDALQQLRTKMTPDDWRHGVVDTVLPMMFDIAFYAREEREVA